MLRGKIAVVISALILIAGLGFAQGWEFSITVEPAPDSTHTVTLAVAPGASAGYDPYIDVPYFTPPDGKGAYFPLDDPIRPKLGKDVRGVVDGTQYWVIRTEGYSGAGTRYAQWEIESLPDESFGFFYAATKLMADDVLTIPPEAWEDMSAVDNIEYDMLEDVVIRFIPLPTIDDDAPYVEGFLPPQGKLGVEDNKVIQFDVLDDNTGVDESTIAMEIWFDGGTHTDVTDSLFLTPIPGGYRAQLEPIGGAWPFGSEVCYSVTACDLDVDPSANCMAEDSIICFTVWDPAEDPWPPYFEDLEPEPNSVGVDLPVTIQALVKDSETGVDESSIVLIVDGDTISHDDPNLLIVQLGTGIKDYRITYFFTGADYSTEYTVELYAGDYASPSQNVGDTSWTFTTQARPPLPEFEWTNGLIVHSINITDTAKTRLTIGIDESGTDGYDAGLDDPQFLAPRVGYFPISDPEYLGNALKTDIRNTEPVIKEWVIKVYTPNNDLMVCWDNEALPLPDSVARFEYGIAEIGSQPETWMYMSETDTVEYSSDEDFYIRMLPVGPDTIPPRIIYKSHEGSGGDPMQSLCIDLVDYETGLDISTFMMTVNGLEVTPTSMTPITSGYRICYMPDGGWQPATEYNFEVDAEDWASPVNHLHEEWSCVMSYFDEFPEFDLLFKFVNSSTPDDTESVELGLDDEATIGFDVGTDIVMPPPMYPPMVGYHFYREGEPAPKDKLVKDIRNTFDGGTIWEVGWDVSPGMDDATVTWDGTDPIFGSENFCIFYTVQGYADPEPSRPMESYGDWTKLIGEDYITYNPATQKLYFSIDWWDTVEVPQSFSIEGHVTLYGLEGEDYSGVEVRITGGGVRYTDSTGYYLFENLLFEEPSKCYELVFTYPEYDTVKDSVCGTNPDEVIEHDVIMYSGTQRVFGKITVAGEEESGVSVTLEGPDNLATMTNLTSDYEFPHVLAGDYELCARYPGYATWCTTFTLGTEDVEINYDLNTFNVDVSGAAMLDGDSIAGIYIIADGDTEMVTDSTGVFSIVVSIGTHTICAYYPGYEVVCTTLYVGEDGIEDLLFDITEMITADLTFEVDLGCEDDDESGAIVTVATTSKTTPGNGIVTFEDLDWGEWYYYTIEADYHRTVEDSVYLDPEGTIVEVTLCCLDPVTDLEATGETVERPTLDPLTIELEWTAADSTCCDPDTYYIYRSESPFLNVSDPDVELLDKVAHPTVTYDDETVEDGVKYYYDVVVKYVCGNSELAGNVNATSETEPDEDEILIIDWDNDAEPLNSETKGVGEWWYDMLTGTGLGVSSMGVVMTDYNDDGDDPLEGYDLSDYTLVIVALGIQDDDDELLPTETQDKLDAYRATAGGKMIIEGPDFGYDYEGEDFFDNFDLAFGYDGGSETEDSIYSIWGEDDIWDHISLNFKYDAGKLADRNNDTLYATTSLTKKRGWDEDGVTRIFYYNGPSKAIVSTIYLGGIVDSAGLTQVRAVSGYLWTLGISNTGIVDAGGKLPDEFALSGCYPNPFNPVTSIVIDVATNAPVELEIFDITGKHIATLVDQNLARGRYIVTWDGSDVPSGTYFARMLSGKFRATQKLMLIK